MARLSRHSYAASIVVATVVIGAQNMAIQYSNLIQKYLPASWVGLLISASIAGLVYKLVMQLYEFRAWKWLNRSLLIAGKWNHKICPTDENANNDREGEFTVLQNAFETKIVAGKNIDQKTGGMSHWKSLAVFDDAIEDRNLWVIYEIERAKGELAVGEAEIDRGLIRVHLDLDDHTGRIERMTGQYWDAGRSNHRGTFEARRAVETIKK